jgi:hypothetical protein
MSVASGANQFIEVYNRFFNSKPDEFLMSGLSFSDYDGPNIEEAITYLRLIKASFDPIIASGNFYLLTKSAIVSLVGQIQNINNSYTQLTQSRDQTSYQNFANAIDQFIYQIRICGVPVIAAGDAYFESRNAEVAGELQKLKNHNQEIEELKKDIRTLITPAVAGSLSKAFSDRRDSIFWSRVIWLIACLFLGWLVTYETFDFVRVVTISSTAAKVTSGAESSLSLWMVIVIRSIVLLPLFAGFGFAFSQYRKERDFEEEYAHKSAVANSLPNYGDLAREQNVRDQIVTAATTVIFSSPSEQARKAEASHVMADNFREVIDTLGKALSKK